jgi:hypothetical protein
MDSRLLLLFGVGFLATSTLYLLFSKRNRNLVLERLRLRRRRTSGAQTPPRLLSAKGEPLDPADADYRDVYPPSRRLTLETVAPDHFKKIPKPKGGLFSSNEEKGRLSVPFDTPLDEANPKAFTPCEFSVEDIRALGDFPNYEALSGVPLPQPYRDFDIKKAIPRPYRPFRWAYHQTMCQCSLLP